MQPKFPRRFGIEFEHISKNTQDTLIKHLNEAKIHLDGYRDYSGWQVKNDGSITPQQKYPYGIELVTPPILPTKYQEVKQVLAIASKRGAINASCGLHVHVHAPELAIGLFDRNTTDTSRQRWQEYVTASWRGIEKIMFSYVPPSRRHSNFCRPGIAWHTKYMAINFSPLQDNRRTIEFRLHNATLNPLKAFAFAMLCRGIVQAMVDRKIFPVLQPTEHYGTKPQRIHTKHGSSFYLQRDKAGKWLIESQKLKEEVDELPVAFKEFRKELQLKGKNYLSAFHYPQHGNAMSQLCELAGTNGMFRSYMEDRYERMLAKHGTADTRPTEQRVLPDEADFYHEPDFDPDDEEDAPTGDAPTGSGEDEGDPEDDQVEQEDRDNRYR